MYKFFENFSTAFIWIFYLYNLYLGVFQVLKPVEQIDAYSIYLSIDIYLSLSNIMNDDE